MLWKCMYALANLKTVHLQDSEKISYIDPKKLRIKGQSFTNLLIYAPVDVLKSPRRSSTVVGWTSRCLNGLKDEGKRDQYQQPWISKNKSSKAILLARIFLKHIDQNLAKIMQEVKIPGGLLSYSKILCGVKNDGLRTWMVAIELVPKLWNSLSQIYCHPLLYLTISLKMDVWNACWISTIWSRYPKKNINNLWMVVIRHTGESEKPDVTNWKRGGWR